MIQHKITVPAWEKQCRFDLLQNQALLLWVGLAYDTWACSRLYYKAQLLWVGPAYDTWAGSRLYYNASNFSLFYYYNIGVNDK